MKERDGVRGKREGGRNEGEGTQQSRTHTGA